jgi:uncharacterized membrane protein
MFATNHPPSAGTSPDPEPSRRASSTKSRTMPVPAGPPSTAAKARSVAAFGEDPFGRRAEAAARFFGTPQYILGQTLVVIAWIAVNAAAVSLRWDPYPFILLNLAFSTQAAYAAPLILLAQTRQADRDKVALDQLEQHRAEVMRHMEEKEKAIKDETADLKALLAANTKLTEEDKDLTERVEALAREIHARLTAV